MAAGAAKAPAFAQLSQDRHPAAASPSATAGQPRSRHHVLTADHPGGASAPHSAPVGQAGLHLFISF